jgi:hypothetical protein
MQTYSDNVTGLDALYQAMNSNSLDAILMDKAWEATGSEARYATTPLSTGSFYRFEAEYKNGGGFPECHKHH